MTLTLESIVEYLSDTMPSMKGSDFLKMVSKIRKFSVFYADFDEEAKEKESFDFFFSESQQRIS